MTQVLTPARPADHVSYGEITYDPAETTVQEFVRMPSIFLAHAAEDLPLQRRERIRPKRKRYEYWDTPQGKLGRWQWEYL